MWNARSRWSALVTPCIALYWNRLSYRQVVPRPTYHSVLQHSRNIMTQRYSQLFINVCMRMLTNNWFLASKFERVLHCHYTLEWSRAMCLFPQIKCFCSDSYCNKVQYDWVNGRVAWRLTYSKDVNVIVVPSPFFPPYYARWIWRANKHCHIETVTDSMELYLSTPASHKCTCGLSTWHIFDPVRLVNYFVAFNHSQLSTCSQVLTL